MNAAKESWEVTRSGLHRTSYADISQGPDGFYVTLWGGGMGTERVCIHVRHTFPSLRSAKGWAERYFC